MRTRLAALPQPTRVTIIGAGAMGEGLFHQCGITPGIECIGLADLDVDRAIRAVGQTGRKHRVVGSVDDAHDAVRAGYVAVCEDGLLLTELEPADALIESTSAITAGGRFALSAIEHGQHLVLMNAEIDLIFGPVLMQRAHDRGVVYTSCDGDQHGVIKRVVDDMELWGFEPVMGGNMKGFLDRYANPTGIRPEADKRNLDYRMCTAYTDGTKLNIEMALLANALDMRADVPGMHGPRCESVKEALDLLPFEKWQPGDKPFVDYVLGAQPDGGVFAVGYCDHPYQQRLMQYYKMGDGPYYLFYRPYHLCHVEAMECVADAVLDGKSLLEPTAGFRTNVFSYAKKDLSARENLDGLGGYACYGMIENAPGEGLPSGLPICLAEDVRLKRDIAKDQPIQLSDVDYDAERFDFDLYFKALGSKAVAAR